MWLLIRVKRLFLFLKKFYSFENVVSICNLTNLASSSTYGERELFFSKEESKLFKAEIAKHYMPFSYFLMFEYMKSTNKTLYNSVEFKMRGNSERVI